MLSIVEVMCSSKKYNQRSWQKHQTLGIPKTTHPILQNTTSRSPSPSQITIFQKSQNSQHRTPCICNSWCVMASWWVMVIMIAWTMWHRHYEHYHDDNISSPSPSLSLSPLVLENMCTSGVQVQNLWYGLHESRQLQKTLTRWSRSWPMWVDSE